MSRNGDAKSLSRLEGVKYTDALAYVREFGAPQAGGRPGRVGKGDLVRFGGSMLLVSRGHSGTCVWDLSELLAAGFDGLPEFVDGFPCACGKSWEAAVMQS